MEEPSVPPRPSRLSALEIQVRPLAEPELATAHHILRVAFGTFIGVPDPASFMADRDYVRTRWLADPAAALAATHEGRLIGTNFATAWGSVGFFGPLTVTPDYWDRGVAQHLLGPTLALLDTRGATHLGLYTFAHSTKHVALYRKFGFWPRFLTAILARETAGGGAETAAAPLFRRYGTLSPAERRVAVAETRALSDRLFAGLDLTREIEAVTAHQLGDTLLLDDGDRLRGFAVCHCGPGTEAGADVCYVKFGAVESGAGAAARLRALLEATVAFARARGLGRVEAGVNLGRHAAHEVLRDAGFRPLMQGVAMHRPNTPAYSHPDAFVLDDWR